jgi:hypothetical protein
MEQGPLLHVILKICSYKLATGRELAQEAEDAGFAMGKVGIFTLEESELDSVFRSSRQMREWARHVDAIQHIEWFLTEAQDNGQAMIRLACQLHQVTVGNHFELLQVAHGLMLAVLYLSHVSLYMSHVSLYVSHVTLLTPL